jgi:hypothetical protein
LPRQVEIQGLFEPTRQLRSSSCYTSLECGRLSLLLTKDADKRRTPKKRGETLTAGCRDCAVRPDGF